MIEAEFPDTGLGGFTSQRLTDDYHQYSSLLAEYTWFVDTYSGLILYNSGGDSQSLDSDQLSLQVAQRATEDEADSPEIKTRHIGTIADFGGAIELGELVPLPCGASVAIESGLLTVDDQQVTFSQATPGDGTQTLNRLHATVSHHPPRERPDIQLTSPIAETAATFVEPTHSQERATEKRSSSETTAASSTPFVDPANPTSSTETSNTKAYHDPLKSDALVAGDAIEQLERIPPESVQLTVSSPPYNIGKQYGDYGDDTPIEQWYSLMDSVFAQLFRVTAPDGKVVINIGKSFSKSTDYTTGDGRFFFYPLAAYVKQLAIEHGFDMWDEAIWEKNGYANRGDGALLGSYPHPSNLMINQNHEHVLIFRKYVNTDYWQTRSRPAKDSERLDESALTKERWREVTQSLWSIRSVTQSQLEVDHSAVFPEEIPKRAIQMYSFKGDTVLDPFAGTGTTAVAAKKAGRRYIGIDQDESYVDHATDRVADVAYDEDGYVGRRDSSE